MMITADGPSRLTIYVGRLSVGLLPRAHHHGWYRDSYRASDGSLVRVINMGRLIRLVWW